MHASRSDTINFRDGSAKPANQPRHSYSDAERTKAGIVHMFGVHCGKGNEEWHECPNTGKMLGNPALSPLVSGYMVALKRRKVSPNTFSAVLTHQLQAMAGEASASARAITPVRQDSEKECFVLTSARTLCKDCICSTVGTTRP